MPPSLSDCYLAPLLVTTVSFSFFCLLSLQLPKCKQPSRTDTPFRIALPTFTSKSNRKGTEIGFVNSVIEHQGSLNNLDFLAKEFRSAVLPYFQQYIGCCLFSFANLVGKRKVHYDFIGIFKVTNDCGLFLMFSDCSFPFHFGMFIFYLFR